MNTTKIKIKGEIKRNEAVPESGVADREPGLQGNHVFLVLVIDVTSAALKGSASMKGATQPRKGMVQRASTLMWRMIRRTSVLTGKVIQRTETRSTERAKRAVSSCSANSAVHVPKHRPSRGKDVVQRSTHFPFNSPFYFLPPDMYLIIISSFIFCFFYKSSMYNPSPT